jgi:hypothetical protein
MNPEKRTVTRRSLLLLPWVAALLFAGATLLSSVPEARADQNLMTRVEFLGWSGVNADAFLVYVKDPARSDRLEVRQIGNPAPNLAVPVTAENYREVLASQQIAQWSFVVAAYPGVIAPNKWKVFSQQEGMVIRIGVSNGTQSVQIGMLQAKADNQGKASKSTLRTAYWSADSKRVVVVVNHVTGGAWAIDMDEVHGFKVGQ